MKLRRKISQYQGGDPAAMCKMSEGAIFYAFDDAKHDILALHEQNAELVKELEKVREVLHEQTTYLADQIGLLTDKNAALLAALKTALPYVEAFDDNNADLTTKASADAVRAAIRKAKGERS